MLQLQSNRYRNTYQNQYYYGCSSEHLNCGDSNIRVQNHQWYFRSPSPMYHADLPLHMNRIHFSRYYFEYDEDAEGREEEIIDGIKDTLLNKFNECTDTQCIFITCFLAGNSLENQDYEYDFIDKDIWKEYDDDGVKSLFNKCVEQTSLRESERQGRHIRQHIRVFKSKVKHMILMLTDYVDTDQESESFLALGLTPVFFDDYKNLMAPEELDYFKCLVNRSQVKRISNVKPTNCFKVLEDLEKYHDLEREIRYQTLFQRIANARISTIEQQSRQYRNEADNAIRTYDNALKKIADFDILIEKYREGSGEIVEELNTVAKMKGIYDLDNYNGNMLRMTLRVPLDYFDADEAECAIRNVQDERVVKFINDVFIEQKFKLYARVDAYYSYSPESNFQDFTQISEEDCKRINAMFNPHFQFYHCLGDYRPTLIKAMREQDLTLFTNVALAAARSMNFKDGAVCGRWFTWLHQAFESSYYLEMKCLEKDGHMYSLGQWLNNDFETETEPVNVIEAEDL